jgi:hypothetical protein
VITADEPGDFDPRVLIGEDRDVAVLEDALDVNGQIPQRRDQSLPRA